MRCHSPTEVPPSRDKQATTTRTFLFKAVLCPQQDSNFCFYSGGTFTLPKERPGWQRNNEIHTGSLKEGTLPSAGDVPSCKDRDPSTSICRIMINLPENLLPVLCAPHIPISSPSPQRGCLTPQGQHNLFYKGWGLGIPCNMLTKVFQRSSKLVLKRRVKSCSWRLTGPPLPKTHLQATVEEVSVHQLLHPSASTS